jgi:hypothetical protein
LIWQTNPPFGGPIGRLARVGPASLPPADAYRVIPKNTWDNLIYPVWEAYQKALYSGNTQVTPPYLTPNGPGNGVYFTDEDSLKGIMDPLALANRVELSTYSTTSCDNYGCVVLKFSIRSPSDAMVPEPNAGVTQKGLTSGGAREWMTVRNVPLDASMEVRLIERISSGGIHYCLLSL